MLRFFICRHHPESKLQIVQKNEKEKEGKNIEGNWNFLNVHIKDVLA